MENRTATPCRDAGREGTWPQLRHQRRERNDLEALRTSGLSVPTQLVWSSHDPLAPREGGYVLFKIIAERQRATQFHLINRAGSFPFREQPEEFAQVVASFQDGIELETPSE